MRGGPELRITGSVTGVVADTSVEITQTDAQSMDLGVPITTITIATGTTAGWRSGENVEVVVKALGG